MGKLDEYQSDMFDVFLCFLHQASFWKELNPNWKMTENNTLKIFKLLMI